MQQIAGRLLSCLAGLCAHDQKSNFLDWPKWICRNQNADGEGAVMLPSRAIGNVLFPTYEVAIMSLSHSSALLSERIKCSIPLVDNHINIHRASQLADDSGISVKYMIISLFIKHTMCFK